MIDFAERRTARTVVAGGRACTPHRPDSGHDRRDVLVAVRDGDPR